MCDLFNEYEGTLGCKNHPTSILKKKKIIKARGGVIKFSGRNEITFVWEAYERLSDDLQILCIIAFDVLVGHSSFFASAVLKLMFRFPSRSHPTTRETVLFTVTPLPLINLLSVLFHHCFMFSVCLW